MTKIKDLLKKHWGYSAFRPGQKELTQADFVTHAERGAGVEELIGRILSEAI